MIPFAFDVILPDGPLGNGNLLPAYLPLFGMPREQWENTIPYMAGGGVIYRNLYDQRRATPVPISQTTYGKFIYALPMRGGIPDFLGLTKGRRSMFDGISPSAMQAIQNGKALLLLDCACEGHCNTLWRVFDSLYRTCGAAQIPLNNVVFVSANCASGVNHEAWCADHHPAVPITVIPINKFTHNLFIPMIYRPDKFASVNEITAQRSKHFLCFNRRPHAHRTILVSQLIKQHRDKSLISFPPPDMALNIDPSEYPMLSLAADIQQLDAVRPLIIDETDFQFNHAVTFVKWPYLDSYISLTTETHFFAAKGESVFFSEKTYRPIANLQPFIIIGSAGSLRYLRAMDYRTFAPFIDETYDEEFDHHRRMQLILREIDRLAAMPLADLHQWYQSIVPDLIHNRDQLLRSYNPYQPVYQVLDAFMQ